MIQELFRIGDFAISPFGASSATVSAASMALVGAWFSITPITRAVTASPSAATSKSAGVINRPTLTVPFADTG